MKIYLVRHGLSEGNKNKMTQDENTLLAEEGREQAKKVARRLKGLVIDFIYSSPYARTRETAEIISKELELPIEYSKDLVEISKPSVIRNRSKEDPEVIKIENLIRQNYHDGDWKHSDEESAFEVLARAKRVLDHLLKNHKDQNVLCVTHGAFLKTITAYVLLGETITPESLMHFRLHSWDQNTGITVIEHTEKWGWALLHWNDITHLV